MNSAAAVRQQLAFWHGALEQVITDRSPDDVNKSLPNATISSIASI